MTAQLVTEIGRVQLEQYREERLARITRSQERASLKQIKSLRIRMIIGPWVIDGAGNRWRFIKAAD